MTSATVRSLAALYVSTALATNLFGGPLKSDIIAAGQQKSVDVPDGLFFKIRNFSQEGGTDRGVVTVTMGGQTTKVLTAARIDTATEASLPTPTPTPSPSPTPISAPVGPTATPTPTPAAVISTQEPINSIIIAGPAMVTITAASDADAFITYKKDRNSD